MKKMLLIAAVFLGAALALYAGGSKAAPKGGEIVVNFHTTTEANSVEQLIAAFNAKNTGIRVVGHYIPNDDYDDKIKVLVSGSTEVDAFWIRNPAPAQQYITNRALKDLTPYINEAGLDLSSIKDTAMKGATQDNKYYGLPATGSCWMIFYNKDLFDARKIPYPTGNLTWDQYADLAKQLTYTEGGKKYWGGVCPPWVLNLGAAAAAEYLTVADPMPLTRQYAQVLHRMYVDDHSHPDLGEMMGTFDINSFFGAGNVYMMINGDWTFDLLKAPFNYGAAPLPIFSGIPKGSSAGSLGYYSVSARSSHPVEAYKFIEWALTSPEGTSIIAQNKGVPCYPTKDAQAIFEKQITVPGVEYRFASRINQEQTTEPYYSQLADVFRQEIELYLLGEQSLATMFSNFYKLRKEIIDSFK